jgi:hypothetical protein
MLLCQLNRRFQQIRKKHRQEQDKERPTRQIEDRHHYKKERNSSDDISRSIVNREHTASTFAT